MLVPLRIGTNTTTTLLCIPRTAITQQISTSGHSLQKSRPSRSLNLFSRPIPQHQHHPQVRHLSFLETTTKSSTATSPNMTTYNISITSDIVCPWCYVGHTRLSKAITSHQVKYPDDKFNLTYRPFYLNPPPMNRGSKNPPPPPFPVESQPRKEYLANKLGPARAIQVDQMLDKIARQEGLHFKFGGRIGSSRNGHRLIHYAQTHGKDEDAQNKTMLGLWRRYFEQEIDITKLEVLVEVGVEAGLGSADDIKTFLTSGQDGDLVDEIAEESRLEGISGVPFYLVQSRWAIEGAQDQSAFEDLFLKWKEYEKKHGKSNTVNAGITNGAPNGISC